MARFRPDATAVRKNAGLLNGPGEKACAMFKEQNGEASIVMA